MTTIRPRRPSGPVLPPPPPRLLLPPRLPQVFLGNDLSYRTRDNTTIAYLDTHNNVERARVPAGAVRAGVYTVVVRARALRGPNPQAYALAVTYPGAAPPGDAACATPPAALGAGWCPFPCRNGGRCRGWACACPEGYSGPQCEAAVAVLDGAGTPLAFALAPLQWRYFAVHVPHSDYEQSLVVRAVNRGGGCARAGGGQGRGV